MNLNVGNVDRGARVVLALGLFSLFFLVDGPMKWLGLVGLVPLLTGAMGFCPLYTVFGINTCPVRTRKA